MLRRGLYKPHKTILGPLKEARTREERASSSREDYLRRFWIFDGLFKMAERRGFSAHATELTPLSGLLIVEGTPIYIYILNCVENVGLVNLLCPAPSPFNGAEVDPEVLLLALSAERQGAAFRVFKDETDLPLEAQIEAILEALAEEGARRKGASAPPAHQNSAAEREGEVGDRDWTRFRGLAEAWSEADRIREFVANVRRRLGTAVADDQELETMLEWATAYADQVDPTLRLADEVRLIKREIG